MGKAVPRAIVEEAFISEVEFIVTLSGTPLIIDVNNRTHCKGDFNFYAH